VGKKSGPSPPTTGLRSRVLDAAKIEDGRMTRGRPPKPASIRALEGNAGHRRIPMAEPETARGLSRPPPSWSPAAKGLWTGLAKAIPRSRARHVSRKEFERVVRLIARLRTGDQADAKLWRAIASSLNAWGTPIDSPFFSVLPAGMDRSSKFFDLMGRDRGGPHRLPEGNTYFPEEDA